MKKVFLGLGSSEGDSYRILNEAYVEIQKWGKEPCISSFYKTPPWGGVAQNDFLNAVCVIKTDLSPEHLLEKIHFLEKKFERVREVRWADRTLDVDILVYEGEIRNTEILTLPHPYIWDRDFVWIPLLEVQKLV